MTSVETQNVVARCRTALHLLSEQKGKKQTKKNLSPPRQRLLCAAVAVLGLLPLPDRSRQEREENANRGETHCTGCRPLAVNLRHTPQIAANAIVGK